MRCFISILLLLLTTLSLQSKETICLNMIVKDETAVLSRCLDSVKPFIDYWVIVDTGSTDGTQALIRECLKEIPGELHERCWVDFGFNRTEALQLAKNKADYILVMDADDWLEYAHGFALPALTKDAYYLFRGNRSFSYLCPQLFKAALPWKWTGVLHEYLACNLPYSSEILQEIKYIQTEEGSRSKNPQKKYWDHVHILQAALQQEPENERYVFYLAESYRAAGDLTAAMQWYQKRCEMGKWEEEVYWSYLQIAKLKKALNEESESIIEAFYKAHRYRPGRPEALYYLAEYYNQIQRFELAYACIKSRDFYPPLQDILFNEDWVVNWGFLFQLSIASYYLGHHQESLDACDRLLTLQLPQNFQEQVGKNRLFCLQQLGLQNRVDCFANLLHKAKQIENMRSPEQEIIEAYLEAYNFSHAKAAEPLYYLSCYMRSLKRYEEAYNIALEGKKIITAQKGDFLEKWIYEHGMLWELSLCAHSIGKFEEAIEVAQELLDQALLSEEQRKTLLKNIFYYKAGVQIRDFAEQKWGALQHVEPPKEPQLHVCCIATHPCQELDQLLRSCACNEITLNVLGAGQPFTFGKKIGWVQQYLEKIPENDVVLVIDAYDTLVLANKETILSQFYSMHAPFVISTETGCHPFPHLSSYYPKCSTRFQFLNSGSYIGYAGYLKYVFNELNPISDDTEDQGLVTALYLYHPSKFKLDYDGKLFLTLYQVNKDQISFENQRVQSKESGNFPCVIHGNGPGKSMYYYIYNTLFNET